MEIYSNNNILNDYYKLSYEFRDAYRLCANYTGSNKQIVSKLKKNVDDCYLKLVEVLEELEF